MSAKPSSSTLAIALDLIEPGCNRPSLDRAIATAEPGSVTAARAGLHPVALVVLRDGSAFAVDDLCPHDGGLLSDGYLEGDALVCARHGWAFDACTGRCPAHPRFRLQLLPIS